MKKLGAKQIAIHSQDKIIHDAFVYLAENDIKIALEMLQCFDKDILRTELFRQLSEMIYLKVMNVPQLLNIYKTSERDNISFDQRINYIILLKYNLQFDKAKEEAERLINLYPKENRESQIRYLELLSEICLFTGDIDKSVEYITFAKDLAQELVYNPVHQLYMSRLLRCGKEEGISYGIQFKQTHPNVVNWMKSFQALEKNEDGETKLTDEFLDIINNMNKSFETALSYYRNETISFYQLQKFLGSDLYTMLSIPDNNGVRFVIGTGNVEKIEEQGKQIGNKIVVDAMTILFIRYYDIARILDAFSTIYVTYSSVEELEKIFIQMRDTLIEDIILWLKNDLRVELYPNYSEKSEEDAFYHPDYFMDSLETAKRENCQFLCIDARSPRFFADVAGCFINVMSLVHREEGEKSSILVARLLAHNVTFINFRADDIIYLLTNGKDEMVISKLFSIEFSCDSLSFISVYRIAIIRILNSDEKELINIFLTHICKQIDRTFSRARMYKWRSEEYQDTDLFLKYEYYAKHNIRLLFMLHEMLVEEAGLWNKISKYPYKYFDTLILERISKAFVEGKRIEVIKELLNYYCISNN